MGKSCSRIAPKMYATFCGHHEIVQVLLAQLVDLNTEKNFDLAYKNTLIAAVPNHCGKLDQMLLYYGANINLGPKTI